MKIIDEFKEFAIRGNAIDLAVGIIIGAGFSKIVTSLVEDVIMPPIGILVGDIDFTNLDLVIRSAGDGTEAVTINYGTFISTIFEFAVIAFSVFLVIRYINKLKRADDDTAEAPVRKCDHCKEPIADEASRCPHCTATLNT
ncbi:MAG: large-conductance mechanosensitive channel protein MscL [Candidatus Paceibacterota bacterium]